MTHGKIDSNGVLSILRHDEFVMCICKEDHNAFCRHTCPSFREPYIGVDENTYLEICNDEIEFEEFDDERAK